MTLKNALSILPIGAFVLGYSFLFGLLGPLGTAALSTITYVDIVEAAIANLVPLLAASFFLVGITSGEVDGLSSFKAPWKLAILFAAVAGAVLLWVFTGSIAMFVVLVVSAGYYFFRLTVSKSEYEFGIVTLVFLTGMIWAAWTVGSRTLEEAHMQNATQVLLKKDGDEQLNLVFSLDRNIVVFDQVQK